MSESVCVEYPNGVREWRKPDGTLHREDGPAIEWDNGYKQWCFNGMLHRKGGPAVEYPDGGSKEWFFKGKVHRTDGPALEKYDGDRHWLVNDLHHRTDGPAIICVEEQEVMWWLKGKRTCKKEVSNRLLSTNLKIKMLARVVNHFCPIAISGYGW